MGVYHLKQTLYQIMLRISKILGKFRQTLKNLQTKIDKELILAALNYCLLYFNIINSPKGVFLCQPFTPKPHTKIQ